MTTIENPWLRRPAYRDAESTRQRLHAFKEAGGSHVRLARLVDVPKNTLWAIGSGRQKLIRRDQAERIAAISIREALACTTPEIDEVVLTQIYKGLPVSIPWGEKYIYAHLLHSQNWNATRIAGALAMSGQSVREALAAEVQAA